MGKLPKELREKRKKAKMLRTQGSPRVHAKTSGKAINRQMRRRMQKQGIEGMDQIDAQRVIIQTEEHDLVIEDPQVIKLVQQGLEVYQIIGNAKEVEKGEALLQEEESEEEDEDLMEDFSVEITEADIQLVASQTGASLEEARKALEENNGDLAAAIMQLRK